jgi:hypothetical protein
MRPILYCALLAVWPGCGSDDDGGGADATTGEIDISVCAAENGPFTAEVDNPYLPFEVGAVHVLEGLEAGTDLARFRIEVLDQTSAVGGVTTQVVQKQGELADAGPPELSYYAQAPDGTVCLFGEDEDSDGTLEWEAGVDETLAGIYMPGSPAVGQTFEMAHGPDGVESGEITFLGEPTETPAGTFDDTLTVLEDGPSIKKYARGIGEIYDDGIELISY